MNKTKIKQIRIPAATFIPAEQVEIPLTIFIPNGIITHEECAECREPDIKVEHGKDMYGYPMHFEHCPDCGDAMLILCFDCPDCEESHEQDENSMDAA